MKKILFIYFIALMSLLNLSCNQSVKNPSDMQKRQKELAGIFNLEKVSTITLEISREQWDQLLTNFDANPRNEEALHADFTWERDGETIHLTNIGFRPRGNVFSRVRPEGKFGEMHNTVKPDWHHAHFKVSFDQYSDQEFFGLKGLNLKWFNNDPNYAREVYGYDLFRRFGVFTSSHISYTRLYIHVKGDPKATYFGIYSMIEPIDSRFIQARFQDDQGDLWKCLWGADFKRTLAKNKMGVENVNPTNRKATIAPPYDLKTNKKDVEKAKERLYSYISELNTLKGKSFERWIAQHLDVETFLRYLAVNTMVGMWDDYWINQNNFYVYLDTKNKLTFIPYDYDNTLGTGQMVENIGTQDVLNMSPNHNNRPLVKKILAIPRYQKRYKELLAELIKPENKLFDFTASTNRIVTWENMIAPYVKNDTGDDMEIRDFPAGWGNTPFYRLLSGDHYGGPLPANYFKTRSYFAAMQLGLIDKPVPAKVKFEISGLNKHPKGYYFTIEPMNHIKLSLKTTQTITQMMVAGVAGKTNFNGNDMELDFNLKDPRSDEGDFRNTLLVSVLNDQGQEKREIYTIFQFAHDYTSPEIKGDQVIFRLKYEPGYEVEMRGPFNKWGETNQIFLKSAGKDMYELRTNKTFIPSGTEYYFRVKKGDKRRWITDIVNTNIIPFGYYGPLYIYQ